VPDEIRYWITHSNTVTRTAQVALGAATGKVIATGDLRTITKDEVSVDCFEERRKTEFTLAASID